VYWLLASNCAAKAANGKHKRSRLSFNFLSISISLYLSLNNKLRQ
jgi:hypothetical protein